MQTFVNVDTNISSKQLTFLVDTGADISIVKQNNLLPSTLFSTNTQVNISGVTSGVAKSIGVTNAELSFETGTINQNLHIVDESFPIPTDGILGLDFIRGFTCNLDYDLMEMTVKASDLIFKVPICDSMDGEIFVPENSEIIHKINIAIKEDSVINHTELQPGVFIAGCIISKEKQYIRLLNTNSKVARLELKFETTPLSDYIISTDKNTRPTTIRTLTAKITNDKLRNEKLDDILKGSVPGHVTKSSREKFFSLCQKYADVFCVEGDKLSTNNFYEQDIRLDDSNPVYIKNYRLPQANKTEILNQIQKMLEDDIIEPSNSPYNSPILLVPKKSTNGKKKWRLVVDFRQLNKKLSPDKFPLPRIDDILDQLGRAKYFSTLDLMSGFHQIKLNRRSRKYTAFSSDRGHYQYKRLPFGLNIAPNSFQRMMAIAMTGLPPDVCFLYLDDIIVIGCSEGHHLQNLEKVLAQLRLRNLKLNPEKCQFFRGEVTFLGHTVTNEGVLPDKQKHEVIDSYTVPKKAEDVKRFTAFGSFYRKFIPNYAVKVKPMKRLEKKGVPFVWTAECQKAFDEVKESLKNPKILKHPDFEKPFVLTTDASKLGCGAVLQQEHDGVLLPVSYASRGFTRGESNKSTIEQELTAIHWAVTHFRPYLYGRKFMIQTDHKPLVYLYSLKDPSSKLTRMRLDLEEFDFQIQYVKGKDNVIADALSRVDFEAIKNVRVNVLQVTTRAQSKIKNQSAQEKTKPKDQDKAEPMPIFECLNAEEVTRKPHLYTSLNKSILQFEIKVGKTRKYVKKTKISSPENEYFALEQGFKEVLAHIRPKREIALSLEDRLLEILGKERLKNIIIKSKNDKLQLILYRPRLHVHTAADVMAILYENHDAPTAGHPGQRRMYKKLRREYTWKDMKKNIADYVKNCKSCKLNKVTRHTKQPMLKTTTPDRPMQVVSIDTIGPNDLTEDGNRYAVTVQCELTKYVIAIPVPNKEAKTIARALVEHVILKYGPMYTLKSDLGSEYINETMTEVLKILNIEKSNSTAYHPQTIGGLERNHRVLNAFIRSALEKSLFNWDRWLPYYCFAYNTTPNSVTNYTPFELMFGRVAGFRNSKTFTDISPLYNFDSYAQEMRYRLQTAYERTKALIEVDKTKRVTRDVTTKLNPIVLRVGDKVRLRTENRNKLDPFYEGPYLVKALDNNNNVTISKGRKDTTVHKNRLVLW